MSVAVMSLIRAPVYAPAKPAYMPSMAINAGAIAEAGVAKAFLDRHPRAEPALECSSRGR